MIIHGTLSVLLTVDGRFSAVPGEVVEVVAKVDQVAKVVGSRWVGKWCSVFPSTTSPSVGKRHKLAKETSAEVGHMRVERGREAC